MSHDGGSPQIAVVFLAAKKERQVSKCTRHVADHGTVAEFSLISLCHTYRIFHDVLGFLDNSTHRISIATYCDCMQRCPVVSRSEGYVNRMKKYHISGESFATDLFSKFTAIYTKLGLFLSKLYQSATPMSKTSPTRSFLQVMQSDNQTMRCSYGLSWSVDLFLVKHFFNFDFVDFMDVQRYAHVGSYSAVFSTTCSNVVYPFMLTQPMNISTSTNMMTKVLCFSKVALATDRDHDD